MLKYLQTICNLTSEQQSIKKRFKIYWPNLKTWIKKRLHWVWLFFFLAWFLLLESFFRRRGVVVITTTQLHSTKPGLRFCAGSKPACGVSEIRDGEDLWQWSRLEIRLNAFRRSTIPQKTNSLTVDQCWWQNFWRIERIQTYCCNKFHFKLE